MIVVIAHGRVYFGEREMGVLTVKLVRGPAIGKVIHDDLGHTHARMVLQSRRLAVLFDNVWVSDGTAHESSPAMEFSSAPHHCLDGRRVFEVPKKRQLAGVDGMVRLEDSN